MSAPRDCPEPTWWNGDFTEPFPPEPEEDREDEMGQCDCCGEWYAVELIEFSPADANNAGCDTWACPKCREEK